MTENTPNVASIANGIRQLIDKAPAGGQFNDAVTSELGGSDRDLYFILLIHEIPFRVSVMSV